MTRLEALTALKEAVEEGYFPSDLSAKDLDVKGIKTITTVYDAFNGSLDAAKALHEAVLSEADALISLSNEGRHCAQISDGVGESHIELACVEGSCPARAWLLAILSALIQMEKDQ